MKNEPLPSVIKPLLLIESEVNMSKEKKSLTAKQYLSQLQLIDECVNQDLERLKEMKESACVTGGIDYSRERVQTSQAGDKLCKEVSRYVDFDGRINNKIDDFIDTKEQIISEIRGLRNKNYVQVLYKVYVQYKSIRQAAKEMKKCYSYVIELHKKALAEFEKTYKNLHYLT